MMAGGKVKIKVAKGVTSSAVFSGCGKYRYRLVRRWERLGPMVLFVLQNPSTGDLEYNDPTVAKCCRYAKRWGYSGVMIGNVCAYRSTDNKKLTKDHFKDVKNQKHVFQMAQLADKVILASGKSPTGLSKEYNFFHFWFKTDMKYRGNLSKMHYLKRNKDLSFGHPLYLKEDLIPMPLVAPTTLQDATPEYWDSLSTGGFQIQSGAPQQVQIQWSNIHDPNNWDACDIVALKPLT